MRIRRSVLFVIVPLIVAASLAVVSCGGESSGGGSKVGDIDAFQAALEADGFTVQEGKLEVFDVFDMYNAGIIPSCYGNNAQAPYLVYKLPESPGQTTPNTVSDAPIMPENKGLWGDLPPAAGRGYRLIGNTPPRMQLLQLLQLHGREVLPR